MSIEHGDGQLKMSDEEMGINIPITPERIPEIKEQKVQSDKSPATTIQIDEIDVNDEEKAKNQMLRIADTTIFEKDPLEGATEKNPYPNSSGLTLTELLERELGNGDENEDGFDVLARDQDRLRALTKVLLDRLERDPKKFRILGNAYSTNYVVEFENEIESLKNKHDSLKDKIDDNPARSIESEIHSLDIAIRKLEKLLPKRKEFGFVARYYLNRIATELEPKKD